MRDTKYITFIINNLKYNLFVIARHEAIHLTASSGFGDWIPGIRVLQAAWIASCLAMTKRREHDRILRWITSSRATTKVIVFENMQLP